MEVEKVLDNDKIVMEAPSSNLSYPVDGTSHLEQLLQAFGSMVSLQDIAAAYRQAGCDVHSAGEILCNLLGSASRSSESVSNNNIGESTRVFPEYCSDTILQETQTERSSRAPKLKKSVASTGTVSGVIGAGYATPRPSAIEARAGKKPLRLYSSEIPVSEIWDEKASSDYEKKSEAMRKDHEEFLFKMLGNGFQLDKDVIREVLGLCGYDVGQSIEKLLNMSASTLGMSNNVPTIATTEQRVELCGEASIVTRNELPKTVNVRDGLEKEVLHSLFSVPERIEREPRKYRRKEITRITPSPYAVIEPLKDSYIECGAAIVKREVNEDESEESEETYEILREAANDYWTTMKEYYKAAADAYAVGDHARVKKLFDRGNFFKLKAQEANDKSNQKIVEIQDDAEIYSVDVRDHDPKEAVRLLRCQLVGLSGIDSIHYLKVIVGANDGSTKERARKRQVQKLLESESIEWKEEENGQIMMIRVDKIDPEKLSFAKKYAASY